MGLEIVGMVGMGVQQEMDEKQVKTYSSYDTFPRESFWRAISNSANGNFARS